jgi:ribosomal protein S3AE
LEKGKRISSLRHIGIKKTKLVSSPKSPTEITAIETDNESEINKEPVEDRAKAA